MGYDNLYMGDIYTFSLKTNKYGSSTLNLHENTLVDKGALLFKIDDFTYAPLDSIKSNIIEGKVVMVCEQKDYLKTYPSNIDGVSHYVDENSLVKVADVVRINTLLKKFDTGISYTKQ